MHSANGYLLHFTAIYCRWTVAELVSRATREDLMLLYNLPIFTDGDANAFLAGVARANGYIKKVRASVLLLPLVVLACSRCL